MATFARSADTSDQPVWSDRQKMILRAARRDYNQWIAADGPYTGSEPEFDEIAKLRRQHPEITAMEIAYTMASVDTDNDGNPLFGDIGEDSEDGA